MLLGLAVAIQSQAIATQSLALASMGLAGISGKEPENLTAEDKERIAKEDRIRSRFKYHEHKHSQYSARFIGMGSAAAFTFVCCMIAFGYGHGDLAAALGLLCFVGAFSSWFSQSEIARHKGLRKDALHEYIDAGFDTYNLN